MEIAPMTGEKALSFSRSVKDEIISKRDKIKDPSEEKEILRAVFLRSGSIADPNKAYHLEFVLKSYDEAERIKKILDKFSVNGRITERKGQIVLYVKDGDEIGNVLSAMGAPRSLMDFENIRIIREVRGNINRKVNAEAANIKKTVSAGVKEANGIRFIIEKKGLNYLNENLREIALLRLKNESAPLSELAKKTDPPLGRSGVYHRLKKIMEISEKLRKEEIL